MSRNISDSKQERDLLNRIAKLEQQVRERGTLQVQGADAVPDVRYETAQLAFDDPTPVSFNSTATLGAGARARRNFSVRHAFVGDFSASTPVIFQPAVSVYVDTAPIGDPLIDGQYLWGSSFSSLSSAQQDLTVSVVRDWAYGLTPQDPQNIVSWHVSLINHDSSSHTYYIQCVLFGPRNLSPLIKVDI